MQKILFGALFCLTIAGIFAADADDELTLTGTLTSKAGEYTLKIGKSVTYSKMGEDKMFGAQWKLFELPTSDTITEASITISTTKTKLGKWQGAWGSSTSVSPDYWTMTKDLEETFTSTSGSITWEIDSKTAKIIQRQYGGELKWGVWWIDCDTFTIDSMTVKTDGK